MTIRRVEPGKRMSGAVIHGDTVYLAGQVGDPSSGITEQTESALAEVERLLTAAGSSKAKILSAQIWLKDIADFGAMNLVWDAWIDPANPPARATMGKADLATSEYLVEVIVVAAL
ncbi:RidA family protein [Aureimonas leprariae]|uniref:RidA family protein n=1 Tax=Plantimonas leprariae TaxID=2615207 RepID=A0A7V7U044_9HYPH|nr:RidA family protein [Aureimonas leprariae]KAB0680031.1 RidA family protein [Aureimonas leprariae]